MHVCACVYVHVCVRVCVCVCESRSMWRCKANVTWFQRRNDQHLVGPVPIMKQCWRADAVGLTKS